MPLQPFTQNEIDVKTSVVPILHHATNLKLHRRRLPRVADHWVPSSRLVDILHVIPAGPEHPIVPEAVATPACPAGDRVLERPADGHYQRSPGEISEIPVGDCTLVGLGWVVTRTNCFSSLTTGRVPLSPAADRSDIDVIDVGGARIPIPKSSYQLLVVVEKNGIVEIGKAAVADRDAGDSFLRQPLRWLWHAHDAERERLPHRPCLLDHSIDATEVVLPFGRLKIGPVPADVCDGRTRMLARRQGASDVEVKVGEAHSGVVQNVVDLGGAYRHGPFGGETHGMRDRAGALLEGRGSRDARPQKQTAD